MNSYRPVNTVHNDPHSFNPPTIVPHSPHFRPSHITPIQPNQPLDIKPQKHISSNFIKTKELQSKPVPNSNPQNNTNFWPPPEKTFGNNYTGLEPNSFQQIPE